jgi:HEXXH motif-containing protein
MLDLVPLYERSARETYFAPWRADPRPIGGLLQGIYAFLAVAEGWDHLRAVPALRSVAEREFAELREQVKRALQSLENCPSLTGAGERFVTGMRSAFDALAARPVPADLATQAQNYLAQLEDAWRKRDR